MLHVSTNSWWHQATPSIPNYKMFWLGQHGTCQYQSLEDANMAYRIDQLGTAVNGPVHCKIWQKTSPIYQSHTTIMLLFGHA
jgi:hypothetical protein